MNDGKSSINKVVDKKIDFMVVLNRFAIKSFANKVVSDRMIIM